MSDLGQLLIKARTDKGISIEDLQETTKIRRAYLEAIEEGNYKKLPGSFYVRAFIKSYAEAVGLDPDEVLTLYKSVLPPTNYEQIHIEPIRRKRSGTVASEKLSKISLYIIMWLFILLIGGIIYVYVDSKYSGNSDQTIDSTKITDKLDDNTNDNQTKEPVIEQTAVPVQQSTPTPTPTNGTVSLVSSKSKLDTYTISGTNKLKIQVRLVGDKCWFEIDKDKRNGTLIEMLTFDKDNMLRNWELDHSAYINMGRGSALEITVNGFVINTGNEPNSKQLQLNLVP